MRIRGFVSLAVAAIVLASCSGGEEKTATFAVPTSASVSATARPTQVPAGKLKPPPPARMFAGTQSAVGQLTRYCKSSSCTESSAAGPEAYVPAPGGAFVVFSLGETPLEAIAEIRVRMGEQPGVVRLNPNTLMVFNHGLGRGKYLVDLVVRWRGSDARWRFGLSVT